ncbi:hypothetical protein [Paenibacillus ginsengihumi]|uniref:hypothetical protein n=1 Tax=Paenibacillus ginsengihumi TaxID=431596 RepID=UPI00037F25E5|nr:hypothetical protein [Paenibacillus ginsengihumi]
MEGDHKTTCIIMGSIIFKRQVFTASMAALGVTVLILLLLIATMPKRLSAIEYYSTTLFAFFLNATCDYCLNLQFNLYGYFEQGIDIGGYIIVYIVGPCISMLFLNPEFRKPIKAVSL